MDNNKKPRQIILSPYGSSPEAIATIFFIILALGYTYKWIGDIVFTLIGITLYIFLIVGIVRKVRAKKIKEIFFNKVTFFVAFGMIIPSLIYAIIVLVVYRLAGKS